MSLRLKVNSLTEKQRNALEDLTRHAVGRIAERARMVLLSTEGKTVSEIAHIFCCAENKVRRWVKRYETHGIAGLYDQPRPGRPKTTLKPEGVYLDGSKRQSVRKAYFRNERD